MIDRLFLFTAAVAVLLIGVGAAPFITSPRTPAAGAPTPNTAAVTSVDRAKTLPCQRFRQSPDGSWTMIGPVQANGTDLENVTFAKGTAEAAILGQRCSY